jgi:glycosyltransferase involved in cell wall biosynthesis
MIVGRRSVSAMDEVCSFGMVCHGSASQRPAAATVIISLYNYQDHIVECLESVRAQTMADLDLVVVDDCSQDASLAVVRDWLDRWGDRFSRYLLLHYKTNGGLARARNTAFAHSRTEYVFVLDADNLIYPRCVAALVSALDNCTASFAYCVHEKFGEVHSISNMGPWSPATLSTGNMVDAMALLRKSVWETMGGYSTNMPVMGWEDFDLWFKIARAKGWGILVPEILAKYRFHRGSMLNSITNPKVNRLWAHLRATYPEFLKK